MDCPDLQPVHMSIKQYCMQIVSIETRLGARIPAELLRSWIAQQHVPYWYRQYSPFSGFCDLDVLCAAISSFNRGSLNTDGELEMHVHPASTAAQVVVPYPMEIEKHPIGTQLSQPVPHKPVGEGAESGVAGDAGISGDHNVVSTQKDPLP